MGKRIRNNKEVGVSNGIHCHHTHPGRVWGILHIIKYHHWRHVKRRISHRRHCNGGSHDASKSMFKSCRVWCLTYVSVQNHYNIYQRICIVSYILVFVLLYI
jgi:hypothetical protein